MNHELIKAHIRDIPDFPKPGILFKDITPLLSNPDAFSATIDALEARYSSMHIDKIAAIESRGFVFASPLACALGTGFIPLRKPGKLPADTLTEAYSLEYGEAALEIHRDALTEGERVLIFDDLLATGGTAAASVALVRRLGATVVECGFVIELTALKGRDRLKDTPVYSLIEFS